MNTNQKIQKTTDLTKSQWYTACWNYFSLLSGQRMQMLQFFISLEVFLSGAFVTLICLNTRLRWAEISVSALIFVMAIVFMGLDYRTRTMIHECEKSMIEIEEADSSSSSFNPITCVNTNRKTFFTYSKWIRFLQLVFASAGITCICLIMFHIV